MPFPDVSPYEILEVSPSAGLAEIMKAYQLALKKRRFPPARITQVFNELRNPRKRAEHDLLTFCHIGGGGSAKQILANLPKASFVSEEVSVLPVAVICEPTGPCGVEQDFVPIPTCPLAFQSSDRYSSLESVLPPVVFPV